MTREALGCRLVRGSDVPAPVLIASDTDGRATGGWANLTSLLPGRVRLDRLGPTAVDALADVAVAVHVLEVADEGPPLVRGLDEPRAGRTGLGLQIVRRTAARAGGHFTWQHDGTGTLARVTLPAAPD